MYYDNYVVSLRAFMLIQPERFADQPLDAVAADRIADRGGHGKAKAAIPQLIGAAADGDRPGSCSQLSGEDGGERASAVKPQSSREPV